MQSAGQARYQTTAAVAETEASTAHLAGKAHRNAEVTQEVAKQVAHEAQQHPHLPAQPASETTTAAKAVAQSPAAADTAERTRDVAEDAALAAQQKGPGVTGELKDVVPQAKATTDAAVVEGKRDVHSAVTAGQGYLQQAMGMASDAVASAQQYLADTAGTFTGAGDHSNAANRDASTTSAVDTARQYAAQAQTVAQPHLEAAAKAIQSGAASAAQAAQDYLAKSNVPGVSAGTTTTVPAKTAPLESGIHTSDYVYPEGGDATKFGETA